MKTIEVEGTIQDYSVDFFSLKLNSGEVITVALSKPYDCWLMYELTSRGVFDGFFKIKKISKEQDVFYSFDGFKKNLNG